MTLYSHRLTFPIGALDQCVCQCALFCQFLFKQESNKLIDHIVTLSCLSTTNPFSSEFSSTHLSGIHGGRDRPVLSSRATSFAGQVSRQRKMHIILFYSKNWKRKLTMKTKTTRIKHCSPESIFLFVTSNYNRGTFFYLNKIIILNLANMRILFIVHCSSIYVAKILQTFRMQSLDK